MARWESREARLADKIVDEFDRGSFDIDNFVVALIDGYPPALVQFCELYLLNAAHKADTLDLSVLPVEVGEAYAQAQRARRLLTSED